MISEKKIELEDFFIKNNLFLVMVNVYFGFVLRVFVLIWFIMSISCYSSYVNVSMDGVGLGY